jgi:hypothetical protein
MTAPSELPPLPELERSFLCTKCQHTEPTDLPLDRHPSCPKCFYTGWVLQNHGYTASQMRTYALQAQALAPRDAWREHVEQRLRTWRQRTVNRSGDQLALDDFMDKDSLDDLIDFVCDEWAGPQGEQDRPKGIPPPKMTIAGEGPDRGHWWSGSEPNEQNWYEQNVSAEGIEEASKP